MSTAMFRLSGLMAGLLLAAWGTHTMAQNGLRLADDAQAQAASWPRWQARFGLTTNASALSAGTRWQLGSGQLLGDYYWSGLRPVGVHRSGGFRATSGLLFGQRTLALGTPALPSPQGIGLTLSGMRLASNLSEAATAAEPWSAVPYVGIGYSGLSLRGGWGFTADVGLVGTVGSGLRTKRDGTVAGQGVDELLRELRLTPVLQFGASYAF